MRSSYSVSADLWNGVQIFSLCQEGLGHARVAPQWGDNCFSFVVGGQPILEPVSLEQFSERPTSYGIPILFPFPNRVRDGSFMFRGERYRVQPNRHGFVRDKKWEVLGSGASGRDGAWVTSRLRADDYPEEILDQFPFPFELEVTHRLKDGCLELTTEIRNTGSTEIPCGFGLHPYFSCSEAATIQIPARKRWELSENLPTGRLFPVEGSFDLRAPTSVHGILLDDIFTDLVAEGEGLVRCKLRDPVKAVEITVEFDVRDFPHAVVYKPPAPRRALCIEPYTCPTDGFNLQERGIEANMMVLKPGESKRLRVRVCARVLEWLATR
ncbi:MAG: aldose 1-epimerase [candidate division KSB1 bacterium]|nr:aldose 1-epimerase [candidate division KSB1 bacterium]